MTGAPFTPKPAASAVSDAFPKSRAAPVLSEKSLEQRVHDDVQSKYDAIVRYIMAARAFTFAVMLEAGIDPDRVVERLRVMRDHGFQDTDNRPVREITEIMGWVTTCRDDYAALVAKDGKARG